MQQQQQQMPMVNQSGQLASHNILPSPDVQQSMNLNTSENRQSFNDISHISYSQMSAVKTEKEFEREKKITDKPDEYKLAFESKPRVIRTPPTQPQGYQYTGSKQK